MRSIMRWPVSEWFGMRVAMNTLLSMVCIVSAVHGSERPLFLMLTVDVESPPNGDPEQDILGRIPGVSEDHGVSRIMDILDGHNVKGTFFVDVYEVGREKVLAEVCRTIQARGHDLELHTHPRPVSGAARMSQLGFDAQLRVLRVGQETIKGWTGTQAIAHRAGDYAANLETLTACREADLPLDFSLNAAWPDCDLRRVDLSENAPVVHDGVLCVPVTCYIQARVGSWHSLRFLDIEASSIAEIREVTSELRSHNVRVAVIMMHSFSLVRFGRPNERVEQALRDLVRSFAADPNIKITTAREIYEIWKTDRAVLVGEDYVPTTGLWMTYCRSWQQLGEGWKNIVLALGPFVCLAVLATLGVTWRRWRRRGSQAVAGARR